MRILDNLELAKIQKKKKKNFLWFVVSALALILFSFFSWIVWHSGYWLIQDDSFEHVSWIVVLDGQTSEMERTDYALKLLEQGKADSALILGRRIFRDKNNADFYVEDMARTGTLDSSRVFLWRHNDPSTIEEALSIIPWFKQKSEDTVLLVTSAPATKRVGNIFNHISNKNPVFITTDIKHYTYNPSHWIQEREIRKLWFREMFAAIQAKWDLLWVSPESIKDRSVRKVESLRDENKNAEILLPQGIVESVVHESVILDSMQTNKKDSVMTLSSESIKESL